MPLSYSAPAVSMTLKIIESYDIDPAPLLENLDIDPKQITDPNARFDYVKVDQLWYDAVTIAGDPNFGLRAAKAWHPSTLGALGYAWLTSTCLRTALDRFARYMAILTEGACLDVDTVHIGEVDEEVSVHLDYNKISKQQPTRTDSFMAMLLVMCRVNCGTNFKPTSISLTHPAPADTTEFEALFKCPVYFDAAENRFNVSKEVADKQLLSANSQLALINDKIILDTLARLEKDNIIAQVKSEILKQLPSGNVTDTSVADAIYITPRSLQRKLQKENTTFRSILNDLREELAKKYLQNSNMNLIDVAFNLGFAEYSSFSRAFKNWTGTSPSAYRS
jgi:AraC-like DNA-binding protein